MSFLEIKELEKTYYKKNREFPIFKNINLKITFPSVLLIKGRSGCGKTTLLNIISGFEKASCGEVLFDNKILKTPPSYLSQRIDLITYLKIKEIFKFLNLDILLLNKVDLIEKKDSFPSELSTGERQRIALVIALFINSNITILDEPISSLDQSNALKAINLIKEQSKNKIIILSSHDKNISYQIANKIYNLENNKIIDLEKEEEKPITSQKGIIKNNIFYYFYKSFFRNIKKNLLIFLVFYIFFQITLTLSFSLKSLESVFKDELYQGIINNKFYLQKCSYKGEGIIVTSFCENVSQDQLENIYKSQDIIVKENIDYIFKLIVKNNINIQTYMNRPILKQGVYPSNTNEIISSYHNLGEEIKLNLKYFFESDNTYDFLNEEQVFRVVGVSNDKIFDKKREIYIPYDLAKLCLKKISLSNHKINTSISNVYDYFIERNEDNHKYLMFVNDLEKLDFIMEKNDLTFEEQDKVQLLSPSYSYYFYQYELFNQIQNYLSIILVILFLVFCFVLFFIFKKSNNEKLKEKAILKTYNVSDFKIFNLYFFQMLLITLSSLLLSLFVFLILLNFTNLSNYIKFNSKIFTLYLAFTILICLLVSIVLQIINNNKKISELLKE